MVGPPLRYMYEDNENNENNENNGKINRKSLKNIKSITIRIYIYKTINY